ncbi:thioesterase family protein [Pendulispora rubella]|uniref:Thioesterase family protein n=1 Tax=Pendulispora rubella TaxID=2741070 RepID=A0ABZ2LF71_9BACT
MGDLLEDTAVHGKDGEYTAEVVQDWNAFGPVGGYLAVIALRAAGAASQFDRPASISCQYFGPATFGPVRLSVQRLLAGKRAESFRVTMTQQDRPILEAIVWTIGDIAQGLEDREAAAMPDSPPIDSLTEWELLAAPMAPSPRLRFWQNIDQRLIGWQGWHQAGEPRLDGWYRYRPRPVMSDPFADAGRALIIVDAGAWLSAMNPYVSRTRIVAPTMSINVRFYHPANTEWMRCRSRSDTTFGGLIDSSSTVWTSDGKTVAHGDCQMLYRTSGPLPAGSLP